MKKRLLALLAITMLSLTACKTVESADDKKDTTSMFVKVEQTAGWEVVYHKDTKVMYVVSDTTYNCGTFTLLVNPDGTPMLYEEEN